MPALSVYGLNLIGIKGVHDFKRQNNDISYVMPLTMGIVANTMKHTIKEMRPGTTKQFFSFRSYGYGFYGCRISVSGNIKMYHHGLA